MFSDLPQIIIASSGTITASNQAFNLWLQQQHDLDVDGRGMKPLTVFSLVHIDHLSQLFTKCSQALDLLPSERRIVTHDIKRVSLIDTGSLRLSGHQCKRWACRSDWSHTFPCRPHIRKRESCPNLYNIVCEDFVSHDERMYSKLSNKDKQAEICLTSKRSHFITIRLLEDQSERHERCFLGTLTEHDISVTGP